MTKKEMAIHFLQMAGMGKVEEAYKLYIDEQFIHHNQYFKGDRASLLAAMIEAHNTSPNLSITTKYCYEDKEAETVITHSLVRKKDMDIAVVHIFKFKKDKVIELWDLGQIIDPECPNEQGMF